MKKTAAVSWTGGKDSALAYTLIREQGYVVKYLITFVPANNKAFLAHPIEEIERQAQCMNIPLLKYKIRMNAAKEDYIHALKKLKTDLNIHYIATGDIDYVDNMPNWMTECAKAAKMQILLPLWQKPRIEVLHLLIKKNITFRISYINSTKLSSHWLNQEITAENLNEFIHTCQKNQIDICGENGEYHSMITKTPTVNFRHPSSN